MITVTSANPSAWLGLMLAIFQVSCGSYPKVCCMKAFTSSSDGSVAAVGVLCLGWLELVLDFGFAEDVAGFCWANPNMPTISSAGITMNV